MLCIASVVQDSAPHRLGKRSVNNSAELSHSLKSFGSWPKDPETGPKSIGIGLCRFVGTAPGIFWLGFVWFWGRFGPSPGRASGAGFGPPLVYTDQNIVPHFPGRRAGCVGTGFWSVHISFTAEAGKNRLGKPGLGTGALFSILNLLSIRYTF